MGTARTVWFFAWRMTLSGSLLGAALGAAYGILVPVVWTLVATATNEGIEPEVANTIGAIVFGAFYGAVVGVILGAPVGVILGGLDGLLLGALTRIFYYPAPADPRRYSLTAGTLCIVASFPVHFIVGSVFLDQYSLKTFGEQMADLERALMVGPLVFVISPALIATSAMGVAGALVAMWWARKARAARSG